MDPRPARADERCWVGLRKARAALVAGFAKPGAPPDREAGVPAGPPSGAAPCPAAQQSGSVRPQPRSIRSAALTRASRSSPPGRDPETGLGGEKPGFEP